MGQARNEQMTGTADSSNLIFGLLHTPEDPLKVIVTSSGIRVYPGIHYNITGVTCTFISPYAPTAPPFADYDYSSSVDPSSSYISISDIRAQGLLEADYPDDQVQAAINIWSAYIERVTGQWFSPRTLTALFNGNDTDMIFLPVPLISITSLFMNGNFNPQTDVVNPSRYTVFSSPGIPDDRTNPRIALNTCNLDFYQMAAYGANGRGFIRGNQNQKVIGSWGYVEADGSTPLMIQRAVTKLVLRKIDLMALGSQPLDASNGGFVVQEMTDGHQIGYKPPKRLNPNNAVTGDPEVDEIIRMYRAPLKLRATGTVRFVGQFV